MAEEIKPEVEWWKIPLLFDWAGKNGPPFTKEDIDNCTISRILRNDFHPPWEDPKEREARRIAKEKTSLKYPRLSSLTKPQHLLGLKVLSDHFKSQPDTCPTPEELESFQEIEELYEKEEKEYRVWARNWWINGGCLRTLYIGFREEDVYNAQFKLKKNKIQTILHNNFIRAGYISFETRMDAFEFQPLEDLKSVDVQILPRISYPDNNKLVDEDAEEPKFKVPKPCPEHPCKFILPHENELTTLSLPEVHLQLADFAVENGAEFIASENALQCLLETERDWKLPMSVVEVVCPDGGGVKKVVVLDSQFSPQKECGSQRKHSAFRHLLRSTFMKCAEDSGEASRCCKCCTCDEEKQPTYVSEQQLESNSPEVQFNDQSNSNATSESDISRYSSKHDRQVMDDEVSVNSDQFHAEEDNQSNDCSEDELQENVNDQSNGNAPTESDMSRSSSKSDRLVMDDDVSVNSDQFHAEEDNQSNDSSEVELQENVNEQQRRSTKSPEVQFNDQSNINAPSKLDISRSSSKSDRLVMNDDVSVNSDQFHAEEDNQSNDSSEDELQENVDDQSNGNEPSESDMSRSSSKSDRLVMDDDVSVNSDQFQEEEDNQSNDGSEDELQENINDQSNGNEPSESDMSRSSSKSDRLVMDDDVSVNSDQFHAEEDNQSNDRSEDEMQENVNEQQRRSTKSPGVQFKNQNNSNAPSESDISSCGSERNRLVIDDEVSVPLKREHYQTKAEHSRKKSLSFYNHYDSDEEPASEEKQNNAAEEYTGIEKEQTTNQISLDTETLPTIDDNICTCSMSEKTYPRSFKKWQVTNAELNKSHNIIIHASHKIRFRTRETILEPIVEWQAELGACEQSEGKLRALALALMLRPNAILMNVRINKDGELLASDNYNEGSFMTTHGDKRSEIADTIYKVIAQLQFLTPGVYILAHDSDKGSHAMIYTATSGAEAGGSDSSRHTLSLCPDNEKMTHAEESAYSKIPPTLCRVVLPYHTEQEILPLAFTTDKRRVIGFKKRKGKKKANAAHPMDSQSKKRRNKSGKKKNKRKRNY